MSTRKRTRQGSFLDDYRIDDQLVLKADPKAGKSGLYSGFDAEGDPVLVRFWPKVARAPDDDLREIWRHEVRQLHRLGGYPGASRSIAVLRQTGEDANAFYLVLKPGQRTPLARLIERPPPATWLAAPRAAANRPRLWRNLRQLAEGLEILHSQGLLHRNLDAWSVLATASGETDFQLTGFEWSFRVMTVARPAESAKAAGPPVSPQPASFLEDWKAFGRLAAQLLGLPEARLMSLAIAASDVSETVTVEEIRLIRHLLNAEPLDRIDGEVIGQRIEEILVLLAAEAAGRDPKLHLVVQLGGASPLAQQIAEASDQMAGVGEQDRQRAFIADDLRKKAILVGIRNPQNGDIRYALQAGDLLYALERYVQPGGAGSPTWEFAFCQRVEGAAPPPSLVVSEVELAAESLELLHPREARDSFPRLRGKLTAWDSFEKAEGSAGPVSAPKQLHRALALTLHLEALFAAADAFPVELCGPSVAAGEEGQRLQLRLRPDPDREALSAALELRAPAVRLRETLDDDRRSDEWILTEAQQLGRRDISETRWRFVRRPQTAGQPEVYEFVGQEPAPTLRNPVLMAGDSVGQDIQFRRRLKALRALSDHEELLAMLSSPRTRILDSHEPLNKDATFAALDESKQRAFADIVATLPLFLVQGPPGVGKTRLVRDLVAGAFRTDPSQRMLLSAQSNAAVDHLMDELEADLSNGPTDLLIVRCRPRDDKDEAGVFETGEQAEVLLAKLASSDLVKYARPALRAGVADLVGEGHRAGQPARSRRYAMRAFEALVVRSANAVFTTTNSQELERLIEERGQFDWAIVEEAGKATGGELLSPLLLSHRRLMIGDHKQLAPFNSERIVRLLERPEQVAKVLDAGQGFIAAALRDPSTDEVLDEVEDSEGELPAICATAISGLLLFERLIEDEFTYQGRRPDGRKIAHRLEQQHRMHPAIARVVSHAFYGGALKTHNDCSARYEQERCPVISADPTRLPNAAITVVEMPWVQGAKHAGTNDRYPVWHNPSERTVVASVAKLLRPVEGLDRTPSLAILSPYGEQVKRLSQAIDDRIGEFANLGGFRPAVGPGQYCGTVDSFQGNEADVVIVSLVRNNHHSGALGALGFLSDPRRMNVLLSRARWRTILVGSTRFLENVLRTAPTKGSSPDLNFLRRFLDGLKAESVRGEAIYVDPNPLVQEVTR